MKKASTVLILLSCLIACEDNTARFREEISNSLTGTWMLEEYGYSPGSGYITRSVPAIPVQIISFSANLTMSSNKEGLVNYKFYRVLNDAVNGLEVIAFFEENPGIGPIDISSLTHSYVVAREGNRMRLTFRWCFEGCHLGLRKISDEDTR